MADNGSHDTAGQGKPAPASAQGKNQPPKKQKSARQRIRDIERLLKNPRLPQAIRAQKLAEIDELAGRAVESKRVQKETKMAQRYRMVKFFERRKVLRHWQSAEKKLKDPNLSPSERKGLTEIFEKIKNDMNYIMHFPKDEKYISLFRDPDDENVIKKRDSIYIGIQVKVEMGDLKQRTGLEATDGDGNVPDEEDAGKAKTKKAKKEKKEKEKKEEEKKTGTLDDDDFFVSGPTVAASAGEKRKKTASASDDGSAGKRSAKEAEESEEQQQKTQTKTNTKSESAKKKKADADADAEATVQAESGEGKKKEKKEKKKQEKAQ